jgi:Fe(3+) dicitrate transport protein
MLASAPDGDTTTQEVADKDAESLPRIQERMRVICDPIDKTPGSVTYINEAVLQRQPSNDIHSLLSIVPGVNLQDEDGYGLRPNIGLRGSGSERSQKITLLEDGILIAPAPYSAPAAYYFPTAGRMSGIEVRTGSSAIRQGPYTNGGVLNLMSSRIPSDFSGDFSLAGGSDGLQRGRGRLGGSTTRFGWLIETFQQRASGFKDLDGGGSTGFELADYLAKFRVNSGPQASHYQSLEIKLGRTDQTANETYLGLTEADFQVQPYRRYAGSQEDRLESDHEQIQLLHLLKPSKSTDLTTAVYRNEFFRNWRKLQSVNGVELGSILDGPGVYATELAYLRGDIDSGDDAFYVRNNRRRYLSQGIQAILGVHPGQRHDLEISLRYHEDSEDRFQEEDGFRITGATMQLTSLGVPGSQANRISEAQALAFFVRDTIQSGRWTFSPGIRFEAIDFMRRDFDTTDPGRSAVPVSLRTNEVRQWIPGFGVNYSINNNSFLFAGVHRGFAPPGPGATEETEAESSVNYEFGYRRTAGALRFEATAYFNDYENLLGADTLSSGGSGEGDLHNGGAANVAGLETVLHHDFGAASGAGLSVPFSLTYTLTHAEFRSNFDSSYDGWGDNVVRGDELPYVAPHRVALHVGIVGERWSGFSAVTWSDRMRTEAGQGAIQPGTGTDAHVRADLTVKRSFASGLEGFVQARNLTDEIYRVARRPAGLRPGLPRSILAGVSWHF